MTYALGWGEGFKRSVATLKPSPLPTEGDSPPPEGDTHSHKFVKRSTLNEDDPDHKKSVISKVYNSCKNFQQSRASAQC